VSSPSPSREEKPRRIPGRALLSLLAGLAVTLLFVGAIYFFNLRGEVMQLLEWIEGLGPWAPAAFFVVDTLAVVILAPSLPLTLGAGFIFGVGGGTALCLVSRTVGGAIAFLLARYVLSARFARFVMRRRGLQLADDALAEDGGRIVFLTRLVPFFPGKLSNYFFGLSRCPFLGYCRGAFFGMIPLTLANTYMGSLAGSLATLGVRDQPRTTLQWVLDGSGLAAAAVAALLLANYARNRLREYTPADPAKAGDG
jgi:uncharacterized membrane protein YdjX (TVP38/TMEM64 family)